MKELVTVRPRPWYREPWPWLLMLGPFVVMIGCIITIILALNDNYDSQVQIEHSKRGFVVERVDSSTGANVEEFKVIK
ncbi:hypothetical protein [Brackiella oedipodis]|uniref:hypothetical protein n=1 Tax=Brackiella oedipodis TaxID=124225 RepID=UPI000570A039|nr:hypothetical protein [Brackiella oedipodis]